MRPENDNTAVSSEDRRFGRELRVLTSREYRRVFDDNRRRADPFAVLLGHDGERPHARLGITVSKKVSKKAVVRNRIKRQIREYFRVTHHDLAPLDYVVIARSASAGADAATLRASLEAHFDRYRTSTGRRG